MELTNKQKSIISRRQQVKHTYLTRGVTPVTIIVNNLSKKLGVTPVTVYADLKAMGIDEKTTQLV